MVEPLTDRELAIVADYLNLDSGTPDWPIMQTPMGRVQGPIFRRLLATVDALKEKPPVQARG